MKFISTLNIYSGSEFDTDTLKITWICAYYAYYP